MGTSAKPVRFCDMSLPRFALFAFPLLAISLGACERKTPEPEPTQAPSAQPAPFPILTPAPSPAITASPSASPSPQAEGRGDPAPVLRGYADALHARDWKRAAKVWGKNSGVTAAILKAAYDRPERPVLEIGKATVEGAAGSLYAEAPVVLRFGKNAPEERGSLTLRRVNDVPGASADQLRWHIERATIGVGQ